MAIGDSESWSGRIEDGGSWGRGAARGRWRPDSSTALGPAWMGRDRHRGCGRTDSLTPPVRGHGSSCDMRPPVREGRRAGEHLDAPKGGFATRGAWREPTMARSRANDQFRPLAEGVGETLAPKRPRRVDQSGVAEETPKSRPCRKPRSLQGGRAKSDRVPRAPSPIR